jgi:hypothetical protein
MAGCKFLDRVGQDRGQVAADVAGELAKKNAAEPVGVPGPVSGFTADRPH